MKTKKSFFAIIMACLMFITTLPLTAFAHESTNADEYYGEVSVVDMSQFEILDESVMSREEAISMLGLTPEEAEQVQLYTCELGSDSSDGATARAIEVLNAGDVKPYDLTFHRYNRGLDRKFNGNKMKWAAHLTSTNGTMVSLVRCSYDVPSGYETMDLTPGEYDTLYTTWFKIYYGGTYYWKYYGYGGTYDNPAQHTVRLVIAIL